MMKLTPDDCAFNEGIFELANDTKFGVEALITEENFDAENLRVAQIVEAFSDMVFEKGLVHFPQLHEMNQRGFMLVAATANAASYQKLHYDYGSQNSISAFLLKEPRKNHRTLWVPNTFLAEKEFPATATDKKTDESQRARDHDLIIKKRFGVCINGELGLILISNKFGLHARTKATIKNDKKYSIDDPLWLYYKKFLTK